MDKKNKLDNQEQIWDAIAEDWSKFRNRIVKEVSEFLKNKKGKILDMGCGSGRNFTTNPELKFFGVDFSAKMLEFAKRKALKDNIKVVLCKSTLENLPFKDNFFEAAIYISTLHCIKNENERRKSLQELFRVLKKGREAMISVWNIESRKTIKNNVKEGYVYWQKNGKKHRRYYYFYEHDELLSELRNIGFKIIKKEITSEEKHSKKNIIFYVKK
jgi:ubiquinone/menaquinone biosynthesis C-methylase UbiE